MSIIQTGWENITHDAPGSVTEARERITHVLDADPFVRMLSPEIRGCMLDAFINALARRRATPVEDAIACYNHGSVTRDIALCLKKMPLGFLTDDFRKHLVSLVAFAILPHPEYDQWHNPI